MRSTNVRSSAKGLACRAILALACLVSLLVPAASWAMAQDADRAMTAVYARALPAIDGSVAEWYALAPTDLTKDTASSIVKEVPSYTDLTVQMRTAWNGEALYFAADIRDDVVIQYDSAKSWDDDQLEIGIYVPTLGVSHQFTVAADGRISDQGAPASFPNSIRLTPNGWSVELVIPRSLLDGYILYAGEQFPITFAYWDDDIGGGSSGQTHIFWAGTSSYNYQPGNWGTLALGSTPFDFPIVTPVPSTATSTPTAPASCSDAYEPNDVWSQARGLTAYAPQAHLFRAATDVDWAWFSATAGTRYHIKTSGLATSVNTVLTLYGSNGSSVLAYNDNDPAGGLGSLLTWTAPAEGFYYIKVSNLGPWAGNCNLTYQLSLREERSPRVWLPFTLLIPAPPDPCAAFEPNNTIDTAYGPIGNGSVLRAPICETDPEDNYIVRLDGAATLRAHLTGIPAGVDYDLFVYNRQTFDLVTQSRSNGQDDELVEEPLTAGSYVIRVLPYLTGRSNQPYTLSISW